MNYTTVIFDLFGTLVDDFVSSVGQMNTELAAALEAPFESFMQLWRQTADMRTLGAFQTVEASIEHVCGALGLHVTAEQMAKAVEIRLHHTRRALEPRPNAMTTLAGLKQMGYRIGLLSNCSIEIPILWHDTSLAEFVEHPIFSSRERLKKPDPRIYQLACARLEVVPEQCLYIADGENYELSAAANLGLRSVLIRPASRESLGEVRREAKDWQGETIFTLTQVLELTAASTGRA
jgi:putative hydrolase of the HAD superfamily